jgi:formylglycine-generating enzyme required for sulfatase activity
VGSWPGAAVVPCKGTAAANEVCVPGGAFWMGDPILKNLAVGEDSDEEHLVVISPFFVDLHEVTVADARSSVTMPERWNGTLDPSLFETWCTYTDGPSPADPGDTHAALAANCMTYGDAFLYCQRRGGTLPSEAQYEFVASGRGAEHAFPWGDDSPSCTDAVWGQGGLGAEFLYFESVCRTDEIPVGSRKPGTGARDRVPLVDATTGEIREVVDLAGNLDEWTRDVWAVASDPFWSAPGVRKDPIYTKTYVPGTELDRAARGGKWYDVPVNLRAGHRRYLIDQDGKGGIYFYNTSGWRCVRPG